MKIFPFFFMIIFLFLSLLNCSGPTDQGATETLISGRWNWVKSEGWPYPRTPEDTGYTREISFMSGVFQEHRNGELYLESGYEIVSKNVWGDESNESVIIVDKLISEYIVESLEKDTLVLRAINCDDCLNMEYYKKIF